MPRFIYKLKRDEKDERDLKFSAEHYSIASSKLPAQFDLRTTGVTPPILDQGQLGTCAANQVSYALRYCLRKEKIADFQPSRLYIYYFARMLDGSPVTEDTGISMRSGFKCIQKYGAPSEVTQPYDIEKFTEQPSKQAIAEAKKHIKGYKYLSIPNKLSALKQAIYGGFGVSIGIQVYESLESDEVMKTGVITVPDEENEQLLGGHAVSLWGWDDSTQRFIMCNSWGTEVGDQGWFTLPYSYVLDEDLASDFWCVKQFL